MRNLLLKPLATLTLILGLLFNLSAQDLMITGVFDGPLTGGSPKVLELYAVNDIADLSAYTVKNQTNANITWGNDFALSGSAVAGDFIYIVNSLQTADFNTYFANTITPLESAVINLNGDDRLAIFDGSDIMIDLFGEDGVDGTGSAWEWLDGWAYRNADATPTATFNTADWTFSGVDANEGQTDNATATTPFPIGTYTMSGGGLSLPFYETYETWPLENWTLEGTSAYIWESNNGTSYGPGSVVEGTLAAMFDVWNASSGSTTTMTSAVIDMNGAVNPTLKFQFWMEGTADTDLWLKAEMSTDGSTWTEIFNQVQDGNISDWTEASMILTGANATTQIRLIGSSDYGSYNLFVDDLSITEVTCPAVTDFAVDAFTATDVTLSWTENGTATAWSIIYGAPGFDPATEGTTVAADAIPFTVPTLTPETAYEFYVQADCGSGDLSTLNGPVSATTLATCPPVSDLAIDSYTDTEVTLSWTEIGTATAWNIIYGASGFDPATEGTTLAADAIPFTVPSLTSETAYDFYVQADCGSGDLSSLAGPASVTTMCGAIAAPFTEGFENGGAIPACWAQGASNSENWMFSNTVGSNHIGNNGTIVGSTISGGYFAWVDDSSPHSTGTELISPMIDLSALTTPELRFYLISNNEGSTNVDFSVDIWDGAAWNADVYTSNSNTANGGWEEIIVPLSTITFTGNMQIRFVIDENNGTDYEDDVAIDDVSVAEAPSCPSISDLALISKTSTSATLNWTENGTATAWNIIYGAPGFDPATEGTTVAADAIPFTLDLLTANTDYEVRVQADCGSGDLSTWTFPLSFYTGYCSPAPSSVDNSGITNVTFGQTVIVNNTTGEETNNYGDYSSMVGDAAQSTDLAVSITYSTGYTYGTKIWIDWDNSLTFEDATELVYTGLSASTNPTTLVATINIPLTTPIGNYRMRIGGTDTDSGPSGSCYTGPYGSFEDYTLQIIEAPSCLVPSNLTVDSYTPTEATLSWIEEGSAAAWNIVYGAPGFDPTTEGTTVAADAIPFTVQTLTAETAYEFYVQADCGSGSLSTFDGPVAITTPAACPQPTDVVVIPGTDFADVSWNAYGETEWYIKVSTMSIDPTTEDGDVLANELISANPYSILTLTANTTYYVYIQSSCGSAWSAETMFTTECDVVDAYPYFEGFEDASMPSCWTVLNIDGDGKEWDVYTSDAFQGNNSVAVGYNGSGNNDWLISPKFNITSDNFLLEFAAKSGSSWYLESYNVLISTTGTNPADFTTVVENVVDAPNSWVEKSYLLSDYGITSTDNIYIAIQCVSVDELRLLVDAFSIREISSETDILAYSFPEQFEPANIDATAHTIDIVVGNGTPLTALVADFTLSTGATATVETVDQESGVTANDFSGGALTYLVTAEDGTTTQPWTVTVTEAPLNTETDILTYSFPEQTGDATIDAIGHTVTVEIAWDANISNLIADFTLSYGANAVIGVDAQESGVTANDFTDAVEYIITAEDGTTTQPWTVTVTQEPIPAGATCETAFDYGAVNDPAQTGAIAAYESVWYFVTLTEDMINVNFSLCNSDFDTKIEVWEDCAAADYLYYNDDECDAQSLVIADNLAAGVYYVKVYGYTSSAGNYELEITGTVDYTTPYVDNTTITLTPETQTITESETATGVIDIVYPATVSPEMPTDLMTDVMIDLSELPVGASVELEQSGISLGTYVVTGGESVWASEAFTGVNRAQASLTAGQSLSIDMFVTNLIAGSYNVSATMYLATDADLTAQANMTELSADTMAIVVETEVIDLALIQPMSGYGCDFTATTNVPVQFENVGNTAILAGETIVFTLDTQGVTVLTENIVLAEDLIPGASWEGLTTNTIDLSAVGATFWEAAISYAADLNAANDMIEGFVVHFTQELEFVGAVNDTITVGMNDWPYTIETNVTITPDSAVLVTEYLWEGGITEPNLTVNTDGWYTLTINTNDCVYTDSVYVLAYNSVEAMTANEFSVYPNPSHGDFMIEMNLVEKQDVVIMIYNSNGQVVREMKFDEIDQFTRQIDMSNEAEGLYHLRISAGGEEYNSQIVIR